MNRRPPIAITCCSVTAFANLYAAKVTYFITVSPSPARDSINVSPSPQLDPELRAPPLVVIHNRQVRHCKSIRKATHHTSFRAGRLHIVTNDGEQEYARDHTVT